MNIRRIINTKSIQKIKYINISNKYGYRNMIRKFSSSSHYFNNKFKIIYDKNNDFNKQDTKTDTNKNKNKNKNTINNFNQEKVLKIGIIILGSLIIIWILKAFWIFKTIINLIRIFIRRLINMLLTIFRNTKWIFIKLKHAIGILWLQVIGFVEKMKEDRRNRTLEMVEDNINDKKEDTKKEKETEKIQVDAQTYKPLDKTNPTAETDNNMLSHKAAKLENKLRQDDVE